MLTLLQEIQRHRWAGKVGEKVTMGTERQQKSGPPQIFASNKALKLAEQWVDKMTKAAEDEPAEVEPAGRPSRLGLGAKVSLHSKLGPSNDPVERKLQARINAGKRNAAKSIMESASSAKDGGDDDEDEDDDLESRSRAFAKKRGGPPVSSLQSTKKQK